MTTHITLLPPPPRPPRALAAGLLLLRVGLVAAVLLAVLAMALLVVSIRGAVRASNRAPEGSTGAVSLVP